MTTDPLLVTLSRENYGQVAALFAPFVHSMAVQSLIQGHSPGVIWVDDPQNPTLALSLTSEDYLIAGDPDNMEHVQKMGRFLREEIFNGRQNPFDFDSMTLGFTPQGWEKRLKDMIPTHEPERVLRYHYLARKNQYDWRQALPEGYTLYKLDAAILGGQGPVIPDVLQDFCDIDEMWKSQEVFLKRGGGMAVVHENQVVSWCVADLVTDDVVEVGIITLPAYRQRGLGAIAAAAMVEDALERGYSAVSWQCNQDNVGSWKTAEKAGFARAASYDFIYYMFNLIDHLAELGWYYFKQKDYHRTAAFYQQVFALRQENPVYYYTLAAQACAAIGDQRSAFAYLRQAVDGGWKNVDGLESNTFLAPLREYIEFKIIVDQMRSADGF